MERILTWKEFKLFEQMYLDIEDEKNISEEAFIKVRKACYLISGRYPFFSSILLQLKIRENRYLPFKTMATDGYSIHYDPFFVMAKSEGEIIWTICHEIMHNVLLHFKRSSYKDIDLEIWNIAADYAVNQLIKDVGTMPQEVLYPGCGFYPDDDKFENLSAEQIYNIIKNHKKIISKIFNILKRNNKLNLVFNLKKYYCVNSKIYNFYINSLYEKDFNLITLENILKTK